MFSEWVTLGFLVMRKKNLVSQIVLGSIAVKAQMQLAPSALSYLDTAYNLFNRVSDNTRTQKILVGGMFEP